MTEPEERDERLTALEADVAALRSRLGRAEQDAAAARVLARGADRDVADLGGEFPGFRTEMREFKSEMQEFRDQNNRVLSAVRADIVDLRAYVDQGLARIQDQFSQVDRNFLTVNGKIDGVAAGLQVITDLLVRGERDEPPGS